MKIKGNIPEGKAEFLLGLLYPEIGNEWDARFNSSFTRNYLSDLTAIDDRSEDAMCVELTRDGVIDLLPDSLLSTDDELKSGDFKESYEEMTRRLRLLRETFRPLDTVLFRHSMKLEGATAKLLSDKLDFLLKTFYDFDLKKIQNPYIKALAPLLLNVTEFRGNFELLKYYIGKATGWPTTMKISQWSDTDTSLAPIPYLEYNLNIRGLGQNYEASAQEIQELEDFIRERFIPAYMQFKINIVTDSDLDSPLMLDYNATLN